MGSQRDPATWTELAWPDKSAGYVTVQQQDDAVTLLRDTKRSLDVDNGQYAPPPAAPLAAEGRQEQQDTANILPEHGPFGSAEAVIDVSEEHTGALQRLVSWLTGVIWDNGHVCMLLAAFIFSLSVLCVKLTGSRVPVLQITLVRSSMSWIISAVLIKLRDIRPMFGQRKHAPWLIARGVSGAFAMMTFYVAILKLPLADANTLFFLNPAMTAAAAALCLGEPLGLLGGCGCVLSLLGLVLLTHPPMLFGGHADWGPDRILGTMFGVISAVGATGAFICIRMVGRAEHAIVVALYFHTSTLVMSSLPLAAAVPQAAAWLRMFDWLLLLGVAATSFCGQLTLTRGFQLLDAGKAAGLNFSQVLWGYIFGILLFHERLTLFGVLGTCMIAVGMGCVTARTKSKLNRNQTEIDNSKSVIIRDLAAGGCGSVLLPQQQQQQRVGVHGSDSFIKRHFSFQRLLGRSRSLQDHVGGDLEVLIDSTSGSSNVEVVGQRDTSNSLVGQEDLLEQIDSQKEQQ